MLLLSHISVKLWSIRSIGSILVRSVHLVYSVLFDPLRSNSVLFYPFGPLRSTLVLFGLFDPIRSYQCIRSIWSTSVHSVHSDTSVHFYTSVHFSLFQSNSVHSVNFSLFQSIQSTLVLFSPIRSTTVHLVHFGSIQSYLIHFGLIRPKFYSL